LWRQISQADPAEKIPVIIEWRSTSLSQWLPGDIAGPKIWLSSSGAAVIAALETRLRSGAFNPPYHRPRRLTLPAGSSFWSSPVIAARVSQRSLRHQPAV
jgi:hypothetical protein